MLAVNPWLLLGFDARAWPASARLSVDSQTWPSVFKDRELQRPAWIGPVQDLWDDLHRLRTALSQNGSQTPHFKIVAIAVLAESCGREGAQRWSARMSAISPSAPAPSWRWLGHDVGDEYLESAIDTLIANREMPPANRVNVHGLLDEMSAANDILTLASRRYANQGPFCIYGIWEVV